MESQTPVRLHAARTERTRIRRFFAGPLIVVAVLDTFQPMFANHPLRDRALEGLVPTGVSLGGRTATVVAGLALLLLARGIARGKRVAWQLTVLVLAASALVHLLKNLDCDRHDWVSSFYEVGRPEVYRRLGYRLVPIGSDAVVLLATFTLAGRQSAHLRRALHRSEREGVTFSFLPGPQAWDLEAEQLRNVSASWLRRGRGPEMSFSVGTLETLQEPDVTVGLAHGQDGRLLAFVSWLPIPGRDGWCLDLMRRRPDATWGVMEALITKSLEEAKRRGLAEASVGLAPLALVGLAGSRRLGALRLHYGRLDRFRGSRPLRAFKAKFSPRWEPRYLAVPDAALLPEVLAALLGVHLPRPLRLLMGFRTPRRAGPAERRVPAA